MKVARQNVRMVDESEQQARWGEPVSDGFIADAEQRLGVRLPAAWRDHLQGGRWWREGWLRSGQYLQCYAPDEALGLLEAWGEGAQRLPGIYLLGGDGSRDCYCVDLRDRQPTVQLTDITSSGWHEAEPLLASVQAFVDAVCDGTFRAYPDE